MSLQDIILSKTKRLGFVARMPLWFRIAYLIFVAVLVPSYATQYPLVNFLWVSNIALMVGLVAAWRGSARQASMMLISVGLIEFGWIGGFLLGILWGGHPPVGIVAYMFDPGIPLFIRGLSLYHLFLPIILFWMVWRLGYDTQAWRVWLPIGWAVLLITRWVVEPDQNVNWVLHAPWLKADAGPDLLWFAGLMTGLTIVWWLTHRVILWILTRLGQPPSTI